MANTKPQSPFNLQDHAERAQKRRELDEFNRQGLADVNAKLSGQNPVKSNTQDWYSANQQQAVLPAQAQQQLLDAQRGFAGAEGNPALQQLFRNQAEAIRNQYGYGSSPDGSQLYRLPHQNVAKEAKLYDVNEMANMYGLTINPEELVGRFRSAIQEEFDLKESEYQNVQNQFTSQLGATEKSMRDAMRNASSAAVMTGAAKAAQDVSALSQSLGLQQESVAGLTDLASRRAGLGEQRSAALAQADVDAFNQTEQMRQAIATLAGTNYASDIQGYGLGLDYDAQMDMNRVTETGNRESMLGNLEAQYDTNLTNQINTMTESLTEQMKAMLSSKTSLTETEIEALIDQFQTEAGMWNTKYSTDNAPRYSGGGYTPYQQPTSTDTASNEASTYVDAFNEAVSTGNSVAYEKAKRLFAGTAEQFEKEYKDAVKLRGPEAQATAKKVTQEQKIDANIKEALGGDWEANADGTYYNKKTKEIYKPGAGNVSAWSQIFKLPWTE